jgi:hypothetical protein
MIFFIHQWSEISLLSPSELSVKYMPKVQTFPALG